MLEQANQAVIALDYDRAAKLMNTLLHNHPRSEEATQIRKLIRLLRTQDTSSSGVVSPDEAKRIVEMKYPTKEIKTMNLDE